MKTMKVALLATAALAAVSVSARADDASAIKAQLEALNARIAQLEAAPAVPAGYNMMMISQQPQIVVPSFSPDKDALDTATTFSISPTADMPASTVVQWSGYVRAALTYESHDFDNSNSEDSLDIKSRANITVTGTTDTAVGEVGATVTLRAQMALDTFTGSDEDAINNTGYTTADFYSPGYWGWWKMTPELTIGGGLSASLASSEFGTDGVCSCYYTGNADDWFNHNDPGGEFEGGDATQIRLSYASGPLSAAVAVEDHDNDGEDSTLGFAGEVKYAGDTISGEVSGGIWDTVQNNDEEAWLLAVGAAFALGDMANISANIGFGSQHEEDDDYWRATAMLTSDLTDSVSAEIGVSYMDIDNNSPSQEAELALMGGIYYSPVSQLVIGVEAEWVGNAGNVEDADITAFDIVTKYSF